MEKKRSTASVLKRKLATESKRIPDTSIDGTLINARIRGRLIVELPIRSSEVDAELDRLLEWASDSKSGDMDEYFHKNFFSRRAYAEMVTRTAYAKEAFLLAKDMIGMNMRREWKENPYMRDYTLRFLHRYDEDFAMQEEKRRQEEMRE